MLCDVHKLAKWGREVEGHTYVHIVGWMGVAMYAGLGYSCGHMIEKIIEV